jgi:hypothetical protein
MVPVFATGPPLSERGGAIFSKATVRNVCGGPNNC